MVVVSRTGSGVRRIGWVSRSGPVGAVRVSLPDRSCPREVLLGLFGPAEIPQHRLHHLLEVVADVGMAGAVGGLVDGQGVLL